MYAFWLEKFVGALAAWFFFFFWYVFSTLPKVLWNVSYFRWIFKDCSSYLLISRNSGVWFGHSWGYPLHEDLFRLVFQFSHLKKRNLEILYGLLIIILRFLERISLLHSWILVPISPSLRSQWDDRCDMLNTTTAHSRLITQRLYVAWQVFMCDRELRVTGSGKN